MKKIIFACLSFLLLILSGCSSTQMSNTEILSEVKKDFENIKSSHLKTSIITKNKYATLTTDLTGDSSTTNTFSHLQGTYTVKSENQNEQENIELYTKDNFIYLGLHNEWKKTNTNKLFNIVGITNINQFNSEIKKIFDEQNFWDIKETDEQYTLTLKENDTTKQFTKKILLDIVKNLEVPESDFTAVSVNYSCNFDKKTKDIVSSKLTIYNEFLIENDKHTVTFDIDLTDINKNVDTNIPDNVLNAIKK